MTIVDTPDTPEWHKARQLIVGMKNGINNILSGYFGDDEDPATELSGEKLEEVKAELQSLYQLFQDVYQIPKNPLSPLFPEDDAPSVQELSSDFRFTGGNTKFDDNDDE